MIEQVSTGFCENLFRSQFQVEISMIDSYYYRFEINSRPLVGVHLRPIQANHYPSILLFEKRGNHWQCLPAVTRYVKDVELISIPYSQCLALSHGRSIPIRHPDGVYLVIDDHGDIIALATITDNRLHPVVDIGGYLRFESY